MKAKRIPTFIIFLLILICCSSCSDFGDDDYIYPEDNKGHNNNSVIQGDKFSDGLNDAIKDSNNEDITDNLAIDSANSDASTDFNDSIDKDTDTPVESVPSSSPHHSPDDNVHGGLIPDVQKSVAVTFDTDKGENIPDENFVINSSYSLPTPTKIGHIFDGWYNEDVQIAMKGIWTYKEDVTLKAKWIKINYYITYDLNGGTVDSNSPLNTTYQISEYTTSLGIPTKKGNIKFVGWQEKNTGAIFYDIPKNTIGNLELKAMWYEYEYTYKTEDGYLLYLKKDNTLSVVGYEGKVKNLVIPREYNGYVVNEIGKYAFACFGVRLAQLNINGFPRCDMFETITKINEGAFAKCDDLKVQLHQDSSISASDWLLILEIESRNDHVYDVIDGQRPAIGWKKYFKP